MSDSDLGKAQIPHTRDGQDVVGLGAYRVLETFDGAASEEVRDDIRKKTRRALEDFPELVGKTVTIGRLDPDEDAEGRAWLYNLVTLYHPDRFTSMVTVYHELAHLATHIRRTRDEDVPITSEEYAGIFGMARMPVDLIDEDRVPYIGEPSVPKDRWPAICRDALEYREDHHAYIKQCQEWLEVDPDG